MMKIKHLPSVERLREVIDFDASTGSFRWKLRLGERPYWNPRYAGKIAGCVKSQGYRLIAIDGVVFLASRVAWKIYYGEDPGQSEIDHIDRNRSNDRITNLRLSTRGGNCQNRVKTTFAGNPVSRPYRGLSARPNDRWVAQISHQGERFYLGLFDTAEKARDAYNQKALELHGEFVCRT